MKVLTQRLRKVMDERGVERGELAEAIVVSKSAVNSWYTGDRTPTAANIKEICQVLDVSADYLLGLKEATA